MAWKPKEKDLPLPEAIESAKREFQPNWYNSHPLLCAITGESGVDIYPLDDRFNDSPWIITWIDPHRYSGQILLTIIEEYLRRFKPFKFRSLLIFKPPFPYLRQSVWMKSAMSRLEITVPLCVDSEGVLSKVLQQTPNTIMQIVSKGEVVAYLESIEDLKQFETAIQIFLRREDPGLPLYQLFEMPADSAFDRGIIDLGTGRLPQDKTQISLSGTFTQEEDALLIDHSDVVIEFQTLGANLGILANTDQKHPDPGAIVIETPQGPLLDLYAAEDLGYTDTGLAAVKVVHPKLYASVKNLPPEIKKLRLRFPEASKVPLRIFGFRFSDPAY